MLIVSLIINTAFLKSSCFRKYAKGFQFYVTDFFPGRSSLAAPGTNR